MPLDPRLTTKPARLAPPIDGSGEAVSNWIDGAKVWMELCGAKLDEIFGLQPKVPPK